MMKIFYLLLLGMILSAGCKKDDPSSNVSFHKPLTIINSLFSCNRAVGNGANPPQPGTPGGGSGGAIYNDGNNMSLKVFGTRIEHNTVNAHGSAIFFVTNDHTGDIRIDESVIKNNIGGSWYPVFPGISMHSDTECIVTNSVVED